MLTSLLFVIVGASFTFTKHSILLHYTAVNLSLTISKVLLLIYQQFLVMIMCKLIYDVLPCIYFTFGQHLLDYYINFIQIYEIEIYLFLFVAILEPCSVYHGILHNLFSNDVTMVFAN